MAYSLGKHWQSILFVAFVLIYVFWTYSPWLQASCPAPVAADIKMHFIKSFAFQDQIDKYHSMYPVNFKQDVTGMYWYFWPPLPQIGTWIFSFFVPFAQAFFSFYMLFGAFAAISFYFLARQFANKLIALVVSSVFFLYLFNKPFSVGGNYQFMISMTFYFLAIAFFYRYVTSKSRRELAFFCIATLLAALTYPYTFAFIIAFAFVYALYKKDFKLAGILVLLAMSASAIMLPIAFTVSANTGPPYSISGILSKFILPHTTPVSWIYLHDTKYQGDFDFNYGPNIFIAALVLLFVSYAILKKKSNAQRFFELNVLTMLLFLLSITLKFSIIADERIIAVLIYDVLVLSAILLSELRLNVWALLGVLAFGFVVMNRSAMPYYAALLLLVPAAIYFAFKKAAEYEFSRNAKDWKLYINIAVLFLLLLPLTGRVETTTLGPRTNFFALDGIEKYIAPTDVVYYSGAQGIEGVVVACSKANGLLAWSTTALGRGIYVDVYNLSQGNKNYMDFLGITKLVVTAEEINVKGGKNIIQDLVDFYGQPEIFMAKFITGGQAFDYPLVIFSLNQTRQKAIEVIDPVKIVVKNSKGLQAMKIPLRHHKWWRSTDAQVTVSNKDGFVELANIAGKKEIMLEFDTKYFKIGALMSLVSLAALFYILRRGGKPQAGAEKSTQQSTPL